MELSLVNDIDDDEVIDIDIAGNEGDVLIESTSSFTRDIFTTDSLFIVIYEEDGEYIDKLLIVDEISDEQDKILLKDENENDEFLYFDTNDALIMNNSFYTIIDIEKVEEFNDKIDEIELDMLQEMYPDIEIEIDEIKEKVYSLTEKKESVITELLSIYKAYKNNSLIYQITDMVNQIIDIYTTSKDKIIDESDTINHIKSMINKEIYTFPKWIIPVIGNQKKLYIQKGDGIEEQDGILIQNFEEEIIQKYESFTKEDIHYEKAMGILHSYNPYNSNDTFKIPYHGMYLRDCKEPCRTINGTTSFDMNNTKGELLYPQKRKDITILETISPKEQLSLHGLYVLPHTFLDVILEKSHLTLHELYFLSNFKYSHVLLKNRIQDKINPHIISKETVHEGLNLLEDIQYYILEDKQITTNELGGILKNNLPGYSSLIESIPKEIQASIYNYSDFRRAYLPFNLDYFDLNKENRSIVNQQIQQNIKNFILNYNRSVKRKKVKYIKKEKVILSTKDKIKLSLEFIMNLHTIPIRNHYLKQFINVFSREPSIDENKNYLYTKGSKDKLLCKHYLYEIQSDKDPESYKLLKSIYGEDNASDGMILCKVCNNYICHEDFSLLEGFGDGAPVSSREVLDVEKDTIHKLSEEQLQIKKIINKITSLFGVNLNNHDVHEIIEYYELFNNEEFINERYNYTNSIREHPEYKRIQSNYTFIKPATTKKERLMNIKNKKLFNNELIPLKKYLLDSNGIFINTFFILFLIQTSIPSYPINSKISIDLLNFSEVNSWEDIEQDISSRIIIDSVDMIHKILLRMIKYNTKDKFWINIKKLLTESDEYKDLPSFHQQFLKITELILKNSMIRNKLKDYFNFKKLNFRTLYTKESWITYKPLFDNSIVTSINNKTNEEMIDMKEYLLKNANGYKYENISTIRSFKDAYENPRFKQLKIPFSEIMKNESYERLCNYAIHLHGKSPSIPIINLLIQRFIQTITDKNIEKKLERIGWNQSLNELKDIDYSDFRSFFLKELTDYFKEKNKEDKDTINIYIHFHINNWNGMLLNGHSKRNYTYIPPTIYPYEPYEDLLKVDGSEGEGEGEGELTKNFVNELFNRYCLDSDGEIHEKYDVDSFIYNIIDDPDIERTRFCHNTIPKTKENFHKILDYKRNQSKLPLFKPMRFNPSIEKRLKGFILDNNLLQKNADESFIIFRALHDFTEETPEKEYRGLFNDMFSHNSFMINRIQTFFYENEYLDKKQLERFRQSIGRGVESLSIPINKMLESTQKIPLMIRHIFLILSRLSNKQIPQHGNYFHNHIPKQWKLSETNKSTLQEFLDNNEFLFHYDIFIPQKEKSENGFYQYQTEDHYSSYFQGLFQFLKQFYQKDYHTIIQQTNTKINEEYSNIMNRFNILFILCKIIDYIQDLEGDSTVVSGNAISIFTSLEKQTEFRRIDSISLCTRFMFDILIDLIESFIDPLWIYQSSDLSDKLSRQREREKQTIIDSLESKTADERQAMVHHQQCGLSNYFESAEEGNSQHIQTETYKLKTNDERSDTAKELFSQNNVELEVLEGLGVNTSYLQPGFQGDIEENYTYIDSDREGEGLDDNDDTGNYRED